ncbi:hypothetical protein FRC20_007791 [Serendipita sp. 405]|nr:hypothetical protein FRC20_007791 [Serendipita sp. 405]
MTLDVVTNSNGKDRFKNGHFLPILHSEIQKTALTIMISAGAIGGAIFPLAAGLIASRHSVLMIEVLAFATVGFVFTFWLGAQIVSRVSLWA